MHRRSRMDPMEDGMDLTGRLRDRIVSALHVSRVVPGDRLPGIREVAREMGVNPRTAAKAYRVLEQEGLVEVRGRSGVYAARQDHWGGRLLAETGRWLGGILLEAWKRHIPIPDLAELIRGCTVGVRLRAVCIDGNEDQRRAICAELEGAFGIDCVGLPASAFLNDRTSGGQFPDDLREADLVVTTPFYSGSVRRATEALNKPLVVITLHPEFVTAIERRLADGPLTVVCVDPAFGEQVLSLHDGGSERQAHVVLAHDAAAVARLDTREPVLLTRAAQERIGEVSLTPLVPLSPFISPESARELAELRIRLHMEAEHSDSSPLDG